MNDNIAAKQLLAIFNERDKHTQVKFSEIAVVQKEVLISLKQIGDHMLVSEEDKKHDAEFKKETREHIKLATPILYKAKEYQEDRRKIAVGAISFLLLSVLGAFYKFS